ncbi:hypothetical protein HYV22_03270 [Candidatus Gottesmanbacteria bacterium]|nr:hypothetical protein [Candidatus Gottesmanbacteria bacterium]
MKNIIHIIQKKSSREALISLIYFLIVGFLKWRLSPSFPTLLFFTGGMVGMYLLDSAEEFFHLTPSPFRSIVFVIGFALVSFFVVTSTGSMVGVGLVLSLSLTLILWQVSEWRAASNLNRWYVMIAGPVSYNVQRWILIAFILLFLVETFLFLR